MQSRSFLQFFLLIGTVTAYKYGFNNQTACGTACASNAISPCVTYCACPSGYYGDGTFCIFDISSLQHGNCTAALTDVQCPNGTCISVTKVSDGTNDCPNGEDEACQSGSGSVRCTTPYTCPNYAVLATTCTQVTNTDYCRYANGFMCTDGSACIPTEWINNGIKNCVDGSDEWLTTASTQSSTAQSTISVFAGTEEQRACLATLGFDSAFAANYCPCPYDLLPLTGSPPCTESSMTRKYKVTIGSLCGGSPWVPVAADQISDMADVVYSKVMTNLLASGDNVTTVCVAQDPFGPTTTVNLVFYNPNGTQPSMNVAMPVNDPTGNNNITMNGVSDVDECSSSTLNRCSANADCSNTVGKYTCSCKTGFVDNSNMNTQRSGYQCDDDNCTTYVMYGKCLKTYMAVLMGLILALLLILFILAVVLMLLYWHCCCAKGGSAPLQRRRVIKNPTNHWVQTDKEQLVDEDEIFEEEHHPVDKRSALNSVNSHPYKHQKSEIEDEFDRTPTPIEPVSEPRYIDEESPTPRPIQHISTLDVPLLVERGSSAVGFGDKKPKKKIISTPPKPYQRPKTSKPKSTAKFIPKPIRQRIPSDTQSDPEYLTNEYTNEPNEPLKNSYSSKPNGKWIKPESRPKQSAPPASTNYPKTPIPADKYDRDDSYSPPQTYRPRGNLNSPQDSYPPPSYRSATNGKSTRDQPHRDNADTRRKNGDFNEPQRHNQPPISDRRRPDDFDRLNNRPADNHNNRRFSPSDRQNRSEPYRPNKSPPNRNEPHGRLNKSPSQNDPYGRQNHSPQRGGRSKSLEPNRSTPQSSSDGSELKPLRKGPLKKKPPKPWRIWGDQPKTFGEVPPDSDML